MFLALIVAVPIVALLAWAVIFDVKQRRRDRPIGHDPNGVATRTRNDAEGKASEWGVGGV